MELRRRRNEYISDWAYETRLPQINPSGVLDLLRDKLALELHLQNVGAEIRRPIHYGEIIGGQLRLQMDSSVIARQGAVAKPRTGSGGRGVTLLESLLDIQKVSSLGGDWVIQERVQQHAYSAAINPGSVNTVRVQVIRSLDNQRLVVLGAAHRFGSRSTGNVDNVSAGGYVAGVDVSSGRLKALVTFSREKGREELLHHPDTDARVEGIVIPGWERVNELIAALMDALPDAVNVGLDVAFDDEGPLLIEANGNPNPRMLQFHGPFLDRDPAIRAFFHHHGAVPRQA